MCVLHKDGDVGAYWQVSFCVGEFANKLVFKNGTSGSVRPSDLYMSDELRPNNSVFKEESPSWGKTQYCLCLMPGDSRSVNLGVLLRAYARAVVWMPWTLESEVQKQQSFMLVQQGGIQRQEVLWKTTLQSPAPNPLSHKNESEFTTLPRWKP